LLQKALKDFASSSPGDTWGIKKKSFVEYCEIWQAGFFAIGFDAGR
jgi:hypothetical protein